jgi:acyl transferase domain-containing protein
MLNPNLMITMSALRYNFPHTGQKQSTNWPRFFSANARSYAFDNRACGYARGEGVACLLLKPLKTAIADGDPIRGVLRGTGINQDGKTPGITVHNGIAQEDLIRSVYQAAGLGPQHTTYVEAHGTETPTGDPIEARAISHVFNERAARAGPLLISSIKTNIGHLEGASGVAGVIKTVLMLEKGKILPNLHYEKPNDKIDMEKWGLEAGFGFLVLMPFVLMLC